MSNKKELYLVDGSESGHCCFELSICAKENDDEGGFQYSVAELMDIDDKPLAYKMVAAEEMYECLKWIRDNYPNRGPDGYPNLDWLAKTDAALAKARGEQL